MICILGSFWIIVRLYIETCYRIWRLGLKQTTHRKFLVSNNLGRKSFLTRNGTVTPYQNSSSYRLPRSPSHRLSVRLPLHRPPPFQLLSPPTVSLSRSLLLGFRLKPWLAISPLKSTTCRSRLQFHNGLGPSVNRWAALVQSLSFSLVERQKLIQGRGRSASPQQLCFSSTTPGTILY
ncbi:hypothetical protein RHMOL_Rhmol02G0227000 [Rhododendron molle]|uniref:Uncharacterized protein n=1 Tax=Rhododendron molle TaxID=49168 RepID=A0ACC0PUG3_RHOML|nr:hypothetical protein RHMOL_Rhmol02G0227000 [Rhododendron molle]